MKKNALVLTAVVGFGMTVNAQTLNEAAGSYSTVLIVGIVIVVMIRLFLPFVNKKSGKKEPIQLNEVFQEKGFSNEDLILTYSAISPTGNFSIWTGVENPTNNIIIGVKNGVLSFFGGGITMFTDEYVIKNHNKIRHLFDITISDITEIAPQQKEKGIIILNIYEKSDRRTRLCFQQNLGLKELNITLANILMSAFERILETESLSKAKISQINEDMQDALKNAGELLKKRIFKGLSTVVLAGTLIVGGAAVTGVRNWERDR